MYFLLLLIHFIYGAPEGGRNDRRSLFKRKSLSAEQIIGNVGYDLGVGLQGTFITEHLDVSAIGVVGGNLAVVNYGIIKQRKGMGTAPPAGGVSGITSVSRPGISCVFLKPIEPSHILGKSHRLENPHILSAGKNISAVDLCIYLGDHSRHIFFFVKLKAGKHRGKGSHEIPPYNRYIGDFGNLSYGNVFGLYDFKAVFKKIFAFNTVGIVVVENMKGIKVFILGINAVTGKPSAQSV